MGLYRRNIFAAPSTLHGWVCRRMYLCRWHNHERFSSLHDECQCVELGLQDRMVLRRCRLAMYGWHLVLDSGNQGVHLPLSVIISDVKC